MREIRSQSKLGQYRVAAGMTQAALAAHLGCSIGTVHRLETIGTLTRAWATRLSQVLNVSATDLMSATPNVKGHEVMAVRLREARAAAGISSVREASVRLGIPYWKYLNHEQGRQRMKDADIDTYAAAFKVNADWLRGSTEEGGPPRSTNPTLLPALVMPKARLGRPIGSKNKTSMGKVAQPAQPETLYARLLKERQAVVGRMEQARTDIGRMEREVEAINMVLDRLGADAA